MIKKERHLLEHGSEEKETERKKPALRLTNRVAKTNEFQGKFRVKVCSTFRF